MDLLFQTAIWIIISLGIIGAYAMSLSKMALLTQSDSGIDYHKFIYPGVINIIGYSVTGFLWGLELRRLFGPEGPILSINMHWKVNPVNCAVTTLEFLAIWLLIGYFII